MRLSRGAAWLALPFLATLVAPLGGAFGLPLGLPLPSLVPSLPHAPSAEHDHPVGPKTFPLGVLPEGEEWSAGSYGVHFKCPPVENSTRSATGCPLFVQDVEDIMSQPRLVVDPKYPEMAAFHSLHGGLGLHTLPGDTPPSERSRDDALHQPHTVHRTVDAGARWDDNRYYSPMKDEHRFVYGEDNAITLDDQRRMQIGSVYAYRDDTTNPYTFVVALWKAQQINTPPDYHDRLSIQRTDADGNRIDSLHLVYVKEAHRVAAIWRETGTSDALGGALGGATSWIAVAWSDADAGATWTRIGAEQRITGCDAITNPLASRGLVYVGCKRGTGYNGPITEGAFWQVHAIDLAQGTTTHVSETPLERGNATLGGRLVPGRMILAAAGIGGDGKPFAEVTLGEDGSRWSDAKDYGGELTNSTQAVPGARLVDARITALATAPLSRNTHLIYSERYSRDAANPANYGQPEFYKAFASLSPGGNLLFKKNLDVGSPVTRVNYDLQYQGIGDDAFSDLHDDLVTVGDHRTGREFIAFGDYGFVRHAEVIEDEFVWAGPIFANPPPAIPTPAPGVNPVLVGAAAGTLSSLMVARLLMARKKSTAEAPSL